MPLSFAVTVFGVHSPTLSFSHRSHRENAPCTFHTLLSNRDFDNDSGRAAKHHHVSD